MTDVEKELPKRIHHHSSLLRYKFQEGNPVEAGFKWILVLGRIFGVIPHSISLKRSSLTFSWRSPSAIHSIVLMSFGIILLIPQVWWSLLHIGTYPTILGEMSGLQGPMFQFSVVYGSFYFIKSGPLLIKIFQKWTETISKLKLNSVDKEFPKFCLRISIILLGMGCTENILSDVYLIKKQAIELEGKGLIEKLYKTEGRTFNKYIPHYSNITSILLIYTVKFGTYCWNFGDVFLIILCRALSHKFTEVNLELEAHLENKNEGKNIIWTELREKLFALFDLAKTVTDFVSPLVLTCFVYNIFFIILNSLRFIYDGVDTSAYVYVSTIQFALRVILVTYHSSKVYHSTEEIQETIEQFPDKEFSEAANRLERTLARHPVGVTILGAVVIKRKFFISILSFLFTTEIVLLQAMNASLTKKIDTVVDHH